MTTERRFKKSFYGLLLILLVSLYGLLQPRWLFTLAVYFKPGALYAVNLVDLPEAPDKTPELKTIKRIKPIALTIDDGPSPATAEILAVLDRYDAKATFFNISSHLLGHEAVVQQSVRAGHELGNHLTADEPSIRQPLAAFEADLLSAESALLPYLKGAGTDLHWLRPGMGFYSADMVEIAQRHGYQLVLGSVFPYDTHLPSARFASAFILATVQPGDIIVLHDGEATGESRGDRTLTTLKKILPVLKARGYRVTTITELVSLSLSR